MGYYSFDIKPPSSGLLSHTIQPIAEGILYSVSLVPHVNELQRPIHYAEIGIIGEIDSPEQILAVLVSGQFNAIQRLGWTGRHPIVTGNFIYIDLFAKALTQFRLSTFLLKPSEDKTSMEVLDA